MTDVFGAITQPRGTTGENAPRAPIQEKGKEQSQGQRSSRTSGPGNGLTHDVGGKAAGGIEAGEGHWSSHLRNPSGSTSVPGSSASTIRAGYVPEGFPGNFSYGPGHDGEIDAHTRAMTYPVFTHGGLPAPDHHPLAGFVPGYAHHPTHMHHHRHHDPQVPPPIPPPRNSSLQLTPQQTPTYAFPSTSTGSPSSMRRVPSVQVIQPTPTKRKTRGRPTSIASAETAIPIRGSMEGDADDTMEGDPESPSFRTRLLRGGSSGTEKAPVASASVPMKGNDKGEPGSSGSGQGSTQRETASTPTEIDILEAKKSRAREKGRERQRRKRERDKRAREAEQRGEHLPVPSRNFSTSSLTTPLGISVPSSTSSTYSSLPHTQSFYSLSPNHSFAFSSTTSLSGQSSPSAVFSPVISTSGLYSPAVSTPNHELWMQPPSSSASMQNLDLFSSSSASNSGSMTFRPKSRSKKTRPSLPGRRISQPNSVGGMTTATTSAGASSAFAAHLQQPGPATAPLPLPVDMNDPPSKRRKSVPEPEDFRMQQVGLGVSMGSSDGSWVAIQDVPAPVGQAEASSSKRPQVKRHNTSTASGQSTQSTQSLMTDPSTSRSEELRGREWPARSPTPPPLPSLPDLRHSINAAGRDEQPRSSQPQKIYQVPSQGVPPSYPAIITTTNLPGPASAPASTTATTTPGLAVVGASSTRGRFFASLVIMACEAPDVAASLESQLKLSKRDMESLKGELEAVYDRWSADKGAGSQASDLQSKDTEDAKTHDASQPATASTTLSPLVSPTTTTAPPLFATPAHPSRSGQALPQKSTALAATSFNQLNRAPRGMSTSMQNRGGKDLSINPHLSNPSTDNGALQPGAISQSPVAPKGSDSPANSALQTPSTGQAFGFQVPGFTTQDTTTPARGHPSRQAHVRSQTDPDGLRGKGEGRWLKGHLPMSNEAEEDASAAQRGYNQDSHLDSPLASTKSRQSKTAPRHSMASSSVQTRTHRSSQSQSHTSAQAYAHMGMTASTSTGIMSTPGSASTSPLTAVYPLPPARHQPLQGGPQSQTTGQPMSMENFSPSMGPGPFTLMPAYPYPTFDPSVLSTPTHSQDRPTHTSHQMPVHPHAQYQAQSPFTPVTRTFRPHGHGQGHQSHGSLSMPFTPTTPLPIKGGEGPPMWYNPHFVPLFHEGTAFSGGEAALGLPQHSVEHIGQLGAPLNTTSITQPMASASASASTVMPPKLETGAPAPSTSVAAPTSAGIGGTGSAAGPGDVSMTQPSFSS